MERLAWIEVLDRNGDVNIRHPVYAWPLRLGRAYSSDIVLDDPYVAAHHIEINLAENGQFHLTALGSINGVTVNNVICKEAEVNITAHEVVRIGHTQLRIRPLDFEVKPEKVLTNINWKRRWPGLMFGLASMLLAHFFLLWFDYTYDDGYKILVAPLLGDVPTLLVWAGFWALIGRVIAGRANYIAHAVIASLVVAVLMVLSGILAGYVEFAFSTSLISNVLLGVIEMSILGWLLYRHIRLVSRFNRRKLGITIGLLMAGLLGALHAIDKWNADDDLSRMTYSRNLGPPVIMLARGKSIEDFLQATAKMRLKLETKK